MLLFRSIQAHARMRVFKTNIFYGCVSLYTAQHFNNDKIIMLTLYIIYVRTPEWRSLYIVELCTVAKVHKTFILIGA